MPDITVVCKDTQVTPQPVDGVLVQLYDSLGVFVTQGTTGAAIPGNGEVEFPGLPSEVYTARLSMSAYGYSIINPQSFDATGVGPYAFDVVVELFQRPVATDPRLCRASGRFRAADGRPAAGLLVTFNETGTPLVVDSDALLGNKIRVMTDENGWAEVELFRNAIYQVLVEELHDREFQVTVPDCAWTDLVALLFPIPERVSYAFSTINILVDEVAEVETDVVLTSGLVVPISCASEYGVVLDESTGNLTFGITPHDTVRVFSSVAGTYTLRASRSDSATPVKHPLPVLVGGELEVVVA